MNITSGLISNSQKTCLYHRSRMEKYKLGKETREYLNKIDNEIKKTYKMVITRELKIKKKKFNSIEIADVVNFMINGITTLNLLKLNNSSHKLVLSYAKLLLKTLKNI